MQKLILKLAAIFGKVAVLFLALMIAFCAGRYYQEQYPTRDTLDLLPSIMDVQRRLGAKVDGKLGPCWRKSETQRLWDEQVCQQANDWSVRNMPREKK